MYLVFKRVKVVTTHATRGSKQPVVKAKLNALKVKTVKAKELAAKKKTKPVITPKR